MDGRRLRIGTRGSDLALWQAKAVAGALAEDAEIVPITTKGDRVLDRPLTDVGGSALFTREIERALLEGEVDLAVHSAKDLALEIPDGLVSAAILERADPAERLVVHPDAHDPLAAFVPLGRGATVGTSAPRRADLLKTLRPDLEVTSLRGNVPTRIDRARTGRCDAVLLAAAGLDRLGLDLSDMVTVDLPLDVLVPAPAQGAIEVQARADDAATLALCRERLHHAETAAAVAAERAVLAAAGGGCHLPLGVHVFGRVTATAYLFFRPDGQERGRWARARAASAEAAARAAWDAVTGDDGEPCGPLGGWHVSLVGSSSRGSELGTRLMHLGATVSHERVLGFESVSAPDLPAKVARLKRGDAIAVTSREAARRLSEIRVPAGVVVGAVGPATSRALAAVGVHVDVVGHGGGRLLGQELPVEEGAKVLFPCAADATKHLDEALAARGVRCERVVLYRTRTRRDSPGEPTDPPDVRIYMSPSAVAASHELGMIGGGRALALGTTTHDALVEIGLTAERPRGSGAEAAIEALARLVAGEEAAR